MIIDASVLLSALFPDEAQQQAQAVIRDHVLGKITCVAPTLLTYELTNAVWQGVRRQRISREQATEILHTVDGLGIAQESVFWEVILPFAAQFNSSAYDAAYLALAQSQNQSFITGDLRLYNATHTELSWVKWVGDYQAQTDG